jgi:hypothetical protein
VALRTLKILVCTTVGLLAPAAAAQTPAPVEGSSPLVICYWTHSIQAGLAKCDPPSTLVGAVYGECHDFEERIRQEVLRDPKRTDAPWEREDFVDSTLRRIRDRISPQIQGWILDTQISDKSVCKAGPNK